MSILYMRMSENTVIFCLVLLFKMSWVQTAPVGTDCTSLPLPCTRDLPDPENCTYYYQCDTETASYTRQQCSLGRSYDSKDGRCRIARKAVCAKCPDAAAADPADSKPHTTTVSNNINKADMADILAQPVAVNESTTAPQTAVTTATTATTTTTTTTTTQQPPPIVVTNSSVGEMPGIPVNPSQEPPYHIITEGSTAYSNTTGPPIDEGSASAVIGIIAGVLVGLLLIGAAIVVVIFIIRRRRKKQLRAIPRIENPQYANTQPTNYRFSRDSALYVGPTVNLQKLNNNSSKDAASPNKRKAPGAPPVNQHLLRKKGPAPPPPNPFGAVVEEEEEEEEGGKEQPQQNPDLYEKDSHASSENIEMSTFTVGNPTAHFDDTNHHSDSENENNKTGSTQQEEEVVPIVPEEDVVTNEEIPDADLSSENNEIIEEEPLIKRDTDDPVLANGKVPHISDSEEESVESEAGGGNQSQTLLHEKAQSNMSLDDYDKTLNPFFS